MKRLLVLAAAAGLAASLAGRADPAEAGCRPVTVVLRGSVDASPVDGFALPYGLTVDVMSTNATGRAYVKAPQPVTVIVGQATAVSREGVHTLAAFTWGDSVTVTSRICAAKLAHGATPVLGASRVTGAPYHP
jgi:hypothetical protein